MLEAKLNFSAIKLLVVSDSIRAVFCLSLSHSSAKKNLIQLSMSVFRKDRQTGDMSHMRQKKSLLYAAVHWKENEKSSRGQKIACKNSNLLS